jgi:hypothetical protein
VFGSCPCPRAAPDGSGVGGERGRDGEGQGPRGVSFQLVHTIVSQPCFSTICFADFVKSVRSTLTVGSVATASPDSSHVKPSSDKSLPPPACTIARRQWLRTTPSSAEKAILRRPRRRNCNPPQFGEPQDVAVVSVQEHHKEGGGQVLQHALCAIITWLVLQHALCAIIHESSAPPSKYSRLMLCNEEANTWPKCSLTLPSLLSPPPAVAPARAGAAGGSSTAPEILGIEDSVLTFASMRLVRRSRAGCRKSLSTSRSSCCARSVC